MNKTLFHALMLFAVASSATACSQQKETKDEKPEAVTTPADSANYETVQTDEELYAPAEKPTRNEGYRPLTQYGVVEVDDYGPAFRHNVTTVLEGLGFKVQEYDHPTPEDEMETRLEFTATRTGREGTTHIKFLIGEDQIMEISFASRPEFNVFVESMNKSGYQRKGTLYSHPQNELGKIYVRTYPRANTVKICCPFEMLSSNF